MSIPSQPSLQLPLSVQDISFYSVLLLCSIKFLPTVYTQVSKWSYLAMSSMAEAAFGLSLPQASASDKPLETSEGSEKASGSSDMSSDDEAAGHSSDEGDNLGRSQLVQERLKQMSQKGPPAAQKPRLGSVPGLWNGNRGGANYCFFNSTLQALAALQHLPHYLHSIVQRAAALEQPEPLVSAALGQLMDLLNAVPGSSDTPRVLRPTSLAEALRRSSAGDLLNFQQQDAQEFFSILLDACTQDVGRLDKVVREIRSHVPGLEALLSKEKSPLAEVWCLSLATAADVRRLTSEGIVL